MGATLYCSNARTLSIRRAIDLFRACPSFSSKAFARPTKPNEPSAPLSEMESLTLRSSGSTKLSGVAQGRRQDRQAAVCGPKIHWKQSFVVRASRLKCKNCERVICFRNFFPSARSTTMRALERSFCASRRRKKIKTSALSHIQTPLASALTEASCLSRPMRFKIPSKESQQRQQQESLAR